MEIRLHGRGGQGGVTCAKILAAVYARLGKSVQAFGDYAGERSGAPVRAYLRVADGPITDRNKVYQPDHLIVLDPSLLGEATVAGLRAGGLLLVNTAEAREALAARYPSYRVATVDATSIARANGIGSRSVVIVNTTIAGAFVHVMGLPLDALEEAYQKLGLGSDTVSAQAAHAAVRSGAPAQAAGGATAEAAGPAPLPQVLSLTAHVEGPAPQLRTGAWRSQMPRFSLRLAPCSAVCPAGNDVVGFIQALAREDEESAAGVLGRTTPLAGVCGRVCPAFCMLGCNRRDLDGAVDVRGIERWISDRAPVARGGTAPRASAPPVRRRKVAVVGGGPAGLSAAYTLAQLGHEAVVYEAEKKLGGVLHTGIPTYRLPRDVLEREVGGVVDLGVAVKAGERLGPDQIAALANSHDAVILATGLQRLTGLGVPGADLHGIEQGVRFLHRVNVTGDAHLTGHVVVLGGGNTAMDCARSALRLGADRVTVAYRRTEAEMPAIPDEVEEAREEGVAFQFQRAPMAFEADAAGTRLQAIVLAEVEMGPPDDSGRRRPMVTDRTERLACDGVLLALGQSADLSLLPPGWRIDKGRVWNGDRPVRVWAAGDVATNDGTVTHAIGDGRRAATLALAAIGEPVQPLVRPDETLAVKTSDIRAHHFQRAAPGHVDKEPAGARVRHFDEVSHGLGSGKESARCLSCGFCTHCDTCLLYCPDGVIHRKGGAYEVDGNYCKGCGICVVECPRGAMEMVPA